MPLQNRVTPLGDIIATPERGTMLGNRGILHNDHKQIVRSSQVKRWICCVLEYKGIRRTIMKPHSYTELFFLDEATAFAAGHRPCFECRREAAKAYQAAWLKAMGGPAGANSMDAVLDRDRKRHGGVKNTYQASSGTLPDGTFIAVDDQAWLKYQGRLLLWTPGGYTKSIPLTNSKVAVLTPKATVAVLQVGYPLGIHSSAQRA